MNQLQSENTLFQFIIIKQDSGHFFAQLRQNMKKHRLLLVGNQSVGKSSIVNSIQGSLFDPNYTPTIGGDISSKKFTVYDSQLYFQFWDTSQRFKSTISTCLQDCRLVFIVFDLSNILTQNSIMQWANFVKTQIHQHSLIYIIGNKSDLLQKIEVDHQASLSQKFKQSGLKYYQVSAKTGCCIQKMISQVCLDFYQNQAKFFQKPQSIKKQISCQQQGFEEQKPIHVGYYYRSNKIEEYKPIEMPQIYPILCPNCRQQLGRGKFAILKAKRKKQGYSAQFSIQNVFLKGNQQQSQLCMCKIQSIYCKMCNQQCGYHITKPCKTCSSQQGFQTFTMFLFSKYEPRIEKCNFLKRKKQQIHNFYYKLQKIGISDLTIEILKIDQIKNFKQLSVYSDKTLEQAGINLKQIEILRKFQRQLCEE